MSCQITGEQNCKCLYKPHMKTGKKRILSIMRKLFTDHAIYTVFVLKSIVDKSGGLQVFVDRLLLNQKEIGDELIPYIGQENGHELSDLLTTHINLAAAAIKKIAAKKSSDNEINDLYNQGDSVAEFLTSLNPKKLPYKVTESMFRTHNEFVVDMAFSRTNGDYKEEQILFDGYYNEILEMSDAISEAL